MWYWSIINIPLKVYRQPAVIHELESEYHDGDYNSAQGSLLLEDDDRKLRLPTTREEISNWSRICGGLTNLSLNYLVLFIPCLLLLLCHKSLTVRATLP